MVKIVSDSSCDISKIGKLTEGVKLSFVPLKILVEDKEFVDDDKLNIDDMLDALSKTTKKSSTACPSPGEFEEAFDNADEVYVVTITSKLSGSYNSAVLAMNTYKEKYPERNVYVIDSLSTSGEMILLINKINELKEKGVEFKEVCKKIEEYKKKTHLAFCLYSIDNLVKNGRVNKIIGAALNVLGIKLVGRASEGTLQPFGKTRGKEKAHKFIYKEMLENGYNGGNVYIRHCKNESGANYIKELIITDYPNAKIDIGNAHGLVSFYAENQGILVAYESK